MTSRDLEVQRIKKEWAENPRWNGIKRGYTAEDVHRLRGSVQVEHTLARRGSEKLWKMMHEKPFVNSLGALTGNQAMQQVRAGVPAIYLSGWQVAADANLSGQTYPDQSLYPANSVPAVVQRINNALRRADQIKDAFLTAVKTAAPNGDGPVVASFNHPGPHQYNDWAYRDARLHPTGAMTHDDVALWTAGIDEQESKPAAA